LCAHSKNVCLTDSLPSVGFTFVDHMATRGLYPPSGSGRDLYMNNLVPVPVKKTSLKPPQPNRVVLASRTDPPPRYFPNGGGRDLFNCSESPDEKVQQPPEGIMARKIPDAMCRINKLSEKEKAKIKKEQRASCLRLSSSHRHSKERLQSFSPPRSPKRGHLQHFSPLVVNQNMLKKLCNAEPQWK